MPYPEWTYFPEGSRPPAWADQIVAIVSNAEAAISSLNTVSAQESTQVLQALAGPLAAEGYIVGRGTRPGQGLKLPVIFGPQGEPTVEYEVDAFNPPLGIVLEVEAGRGAANNLDYRDIVRASLIEDARWLVMLQPLRYRSNPGANPVHAYETTRTRIGHIFKSDRLGLSLNGILLVGY